MHPLSFVAGDVQCRALVQGLADAEAVPLVAALRDLVARFKTAELQYEAEGCPAPSASPDSPASPYAATVDVAIDDAAAGQASAVGTTATSVQRPVQERHGGHPDLLSPLYVRRVRHGCRDGSRLWLASAV